MSQPQPRPRPAPADQDDPDTPLAEASWNAVAVASVAWQQSVNALRHILGLARDHGLTIDELAVASGLSTAYIAELLEAADR